MFLLLLVIFFKWFQIGIDVYFLHCKYQVKPHSSPWFSAACAAAIAHRKSLVCSKRINFLKVKSRKASILYKRVLKAGKLACANNTKGSMTSQKLSSLDFFRIASSVLNKGESSIPPLFNDPELLSSLSCKVILIAKTLILMSQVSLYLFSLVELI